MLYWIFDLDHTLYTMSKNERFSYSKLFKNEQLNKQLYQLPCKKVIFTNGTIGHAYESLKKIGILHHFEGNIHARDTLNALKPNLNSFETIIRKVGIKNTDKVVFFEDSIENLITAKNYNWINVYINQRKSLMQEVDFNFTNINIALNYFLVAIKKRLR